MTRVRVAINGYGTIGKRVADAILKQPDMELVGVAKTTPDYAALVAIKRGLKLYTLSEKIGEFEKAGIPVEGSLEDLLDKADVVVDATPSGTGAKYKPLYKRHGVKMVFQGGEKADVAEKSFNTLCNYESALGATSLRVVSCNTTGLLRAICGLRRRFRVKSVRATIVRRAADPKEVKRGPINSINLDPPRLPSHHALDVKTVVPDIDIVTTAVVVPTTLMHVHIVYARLSENVEREDIINTFLETPRIVLVSAEYGVKGTAHLIEYARDLGRPRYDIPELVIWEESIAVLDGAEVVWAQAVHQESIVVPENIDAIRALARLAESAEETISITDSSLGLARGRLTSL